MFQGSTSFLAFVWCFWQEAMGGFHASIFYLHCIRVNRPNGLQYLRRQHLHHQAGETLTIPRRINPETRSSIEDPKTVAKDQKQSEPSKAVFKSHSNHRTMGLAQKAFHPSKKLRTCFATYQAGTIGLFRYIFLAATN